MTSCAAPNFGVGFAGLDGINMLVWARIVRAPYACRSDDFNSFGFMHAAFVALGRLFSPLHF